MNRPSRFIHRKISNHHIKCKLAAACSPLERLESRLLLSGAVLASVVRGNLNIQGDTAANAIVLDQIGLNPDQVRISGAGGTSINNQPNPVVVTGVTRGVVIRMGNLDDNVTLHDVSLPGNVTVYARGGTNTITFDNVQVATNLNIQNGSILSTTSIANTTVGRNLTIVAHAGGQNVALQSVEVQRATQIFSGKGAAVITIDDSVFHNAVYIRTGQSADMIQIDSRGGPLGPPTVFMAPVWISLNGGDDILQLGVTGETGNRAAFSSDLHVFAGTGYDTLRDFDASSYSGKSRVWTSSFESNALASDTTAPTVSLSDPADNSIGVPLNKKIAAVFSEPMDPLTITAANVTLTDSNQTNISGVVAYVGTTVTFTPDSPLAANTVYTFAITTAAKDLDGIPLAGAFTATFTSGSTVDITAPTLNSTDPAAAATGVARNKKIAATFSEPMDPLTITAATVTLTAPGQVLVAGTVAYVGTTMTFASAAPLAANTVYTLSITTGAKDLAGNALAANFNSSFTTGATADTTAPEVSSTDPAANATAVPLNKKIAATFSESMDPLTITAANVTVTSPGHVSVAGTVAYIGTTMTFTPTHALAANTTFTATITTAARDLAGNPLANNFIWSFTTGATPDVIAPTVTSTNPVDLQTNVVINKTVAATFSESMNALTITTATFTLKDPSHALVTGTVNYDTASKTAAFKPSSNLAPNTTYTATIAGGLNGVQDLAGNPMAVDMVWTFTTGSQVAQAPINLGSAVHLQ